MPVSARKALIRRDISVRRKAFAGTGEERVASLRIQSLLLSAFPPSKGGHAGLYVPLNGEVETGAVCRAWLDAGGTVYYPAARRDGGLDFFPRPVDGGWVAGPHGVPEPPAVPGLELPRFDLLVVPGVAFDRAGTRLGRGGGCYDRFLGSMPRPVSLVGLAWSWQVVNELPVDGWDIPVDAVVTEKGVVMSGLIPAASPDST